MGKVVKKPARAPAQGERGRSGKPDARRECALAAGAADDAGRAPYVRRCRLRVRKEKERGGRYGRRVRTCRVDHASFRTAGLDSGGSTASMAARCGSSHGGSTSDSPRCAGSSSTAKPGPSVASSNSTPPGSRKYTDLN